MSRLVTLVAVFCLLAMLILWLELSTDAHSSIDSRSVVMHSTHHDAEVHEAVKNKDTPLPPEASQEISRSPPPSKQKVVYNPHDGSSSPCFNPFSFPLSPLENEVWRIYNVSLAVLNKLQLTAWPTDGTLLGMMRHGRISTDRDVDMHLHVANFSACFPILNSLKKHFSDEVGGKLKSFKVATTKNNGKRIGRYVMIRMFRKHGTFDTGVDFNCVYMKPNGLATEKPMYHTHRGVLVEVPDGVLPLGKCNLYGMDVPCPKDGYAVLQSLKPRYDGCMIFPHCMGDPLQSFKKCLSPHPLIPLNHFGDSIQALDRCGYTSLISHWRDPHNGCDKIIAKGTPQTCETDGQKYCFIQGFDG